MNNCRTLNFEARTASHNFEAMKRAFAGILFCSALASAGSAAPDTVALAAQQEMLENVKRLSAIVDELQTAQMALQKQFSALQSDVNKLRDEVARASNNSSAQEMIHELNKQIVKVDESRVADTKRIQEAIEKLGGAIKSIPAAPGPRVRSEIASATPANGTTKSANAEVPAVRDGYDYVVQQGDRLDKIVARYRAEKVMVTSRAVMAANPNVEWTKLQVGQHLFIPKP